MSQAARHIRACNMRHAACLAAQSPGSPATTAPVILRTGGIAWMFDYRPPRGQAILYHFYERGLNEEGAECGRQKMALTPPLRRLPSPNALGEGLGVRAIWLQVATSSQ